MSEPDPLLEGFSRGPDKLELLVRLVEETRTAQKNAYRTKSTNAQQAARKLEKALDAMLMKYRYPTKQNTLF